MAGISAYLANKLFDHVLRGVTYTPPTAIYMALYNGNPTGGGTEISGGGYARQAVTFEAASNAKTRNANDVEFPEATADWGLVTHFGLCDSSTGGNLLYYGTVTPSITVVSGMQIIFKAQKITLEVE